MSDPRITAIQQMSQLKDIAQSKDNIRQNKPEISFKDMMKEYLNEANEQQLEADENIQKIIAGEDVDPHDVMIAAEKANLSFDLIMEIRNKMLEAYKEVIKTPV